MSMPESLRKLLIERGYSPGLADQPDQYTLIVAVEVRPEVSTSTGVRSRRIREWSGDQIPVTNLTEDEIRETLELYERHDEILDPEREKALRDELLWREHEKAGERTQRWEDREIWPILGRRPIP
jgi:hypothetical protein